jgi:hypothetical protein
LANVRRASGVSIGDNLKADAGCGELIVAREAEGARCYGH